VRIQGKLQAECAEVERGGRLGLLQSLTDARVLVLAVVWMFSLVPVYGITFFLPQIVRALSASNTMTDVLTAIPYAVGVVGTVLLGYSSDRLNERRWHYIAAMSLAAAALAWAAWSLGSYWVLLAMSVTALGIYGSRPCFWPMPSQFLTGVGAAAGIALINSIGNLGSYAGPLIVGTLIDRSGASAIGPPTWTKTAAI
jgi:MFS transporter, ACS family, tartrate transporter